jgi:hypothetical protein
VNKEKSVVVDVIIIVVAVTIIVVIVDVIIAIAVAGAVIAVSLTGIAWAIVHFKEAQTLSDEIALLERDPALADAIAKINESAPSSGTPDLPAPDSGGGFGWFLAAAGIAAAAIFIVPKLGKG